MFLLHQNPSKVGCENVKKRLREAITHVRSAVLMCFRHAKTQRTFMFTQPDGFSAMVHGVAEQALRRWRGWATLPISAGSTDATEDELGQGNGRTRTRCVNNCMALLEGVAKDFLCALDQRHVHLTTGEAEMCQECSEGGLEKHAGMLKRLGCIRSFAEDVNGDISKLEVIIMARTTFTRSMSSPTAYRDRCGITGCRCGRGMQEMDVFWKMRVYDKVPEAVAARDGCRVISTN